MYLEAAAEVKWKSRISQSAATLAGASRSVLAWTSSLEIRPLCKEVLGVAYLSHVQYSISVGILAHARESSTARAVMLPA